MKNYIKLIKLRISLLVLLTGYLGYYLGLRYEGLYNDYQTLIFLLIGMFLSASGCAVLNQYLEKDFDAKMNRTKNRPIPSGKIPPINALVFGSILSVFGVFFIYTTVNSLTAIICLLTVFLYLFVYTPSKRFSTLNTLIGSIPGALPVLGGWTAATNNLNSASWILFSILFCWQIPHFLSLAYMYSEDYTKGGFVMLPSLYSNQIQTRIYVVFFTLLLVSITFALYFSTLVGISYLIFNMVLSVGFIYAVIKFTYSVNMDSARQLFFASIIYLPILLLLIIISS